MAIEGYIGRPGSGKSYTLTERALREKERGREVFTNYAVKGCWYFTPDQLLDLPPGVIVIDEAHLWFPARMALRLPPSWLAMLSQTRKNGWDLLYSTQHESRVDRVLRDVSSWMWLCRAFGLPGGPHPYVFRATSWEPEFFRQPKRQNVTTTRFFSQKVADAYDTYERLAVAAHAQDETDAYANASAARGGKGAGNGARRTARGSSSVLDGSIGGAP